MNESTSLAKLIQLMGMLRDPDNGCPWDVKQSYKDIAPYTLEETYEVIDAIENENTAELQAELGDLFFQILFYAQLAFEEGHFSLNDVFQGLLDKMVRRHPHVFSSFEYKENNSLVFVSSGDRLSEENIKLNWEEIKRQERAVSTGTTPEKDAGVLSAVPAMVPAFTRAEKMQKSAASVGFDWPDVQGAIDKLQEEVVELTEAVANKDIDAVADELGDVFFSAVNIARHHKLNSEFVLRQANAKFERRFGAVEKHLEGLGQSIGEASLEEMEAAWQVVKSSEV